MKGNAKNKKFIIIVAIFGALVALSSYFIVEKIFIYPQKYAESVQHFSQIYGVDENLIFALIKAESGFKENAVSKKGAKGLMQITDSTGEYIADKLNRKFNGEDLFQAKLNIEYGTYYIKYLLQKFPNEKTALSAYNAGEGKVKIWLADENYSDDGKTLKFVPYKETEEYVAKVLKFKLKYAKIYS